MKQPTFCGRELLPLSVIEAARAGDPLAVERVLRYYEGYMDKLCTRTLYDLDGTPHVRVDEYMKRRLQSRLKSTSDSSLQRSESTPICSSLTLPFSGSLWIKFMSPRFTRRTRTSHALRSEKLRSSTTSLVHLILRKQGINPKQPKKKRKPA